MNTAFTGQLKLNITTMSNTLSVSSPYDGSLIKEIALQEDKHVGKAIDKACQLYSDRKSWMPGYARIDILNRVVELMKDQVEELTRIAATEGGKPWMDSKVEVLRAINGVQLAVEHLGHMGGSEIPMGLTPSSVNRIAYTRREPIGLVASVSAFNHPLNLIIHQTVPAIAVGSPVIIKPALTTPLSCLNFLNILKDAGLPEGWCQAVVCDNETAEKLVTDPRIDYLSFIGSARVGWYLRSQLAPGTRCALEHGGAAPVIIERDANIEEMIPLLAKGGFYHAGQVCVSVQRVFVHEDIGKEVSAKLAEHAERMKVGDPLDPGTDVGPLISASEADRVEAWVNESINGGAEILCGGERLSETTYKPTVLLNPPVEARVSREEIFGPVICVYTYRDREEAIIRANSLPYAFQASVFTRHLDIAFDTVSKLDATAVMVNDHTAFRVDWMPFGGARASGIGTGGIPYSMQEMTREKLMVIKSNNLGVS